MKCRLCNANKPLLIYKDPVRSGGVSSKYVKGYKVYRCRKCDYIFLHPSQGKYESFYQGDQYRKQFDNTLDIVNIQNKYVHEQDLRIKKIGLKNIFLKEIADFGAGSGIFLNAIKGIVKNTYAIEPMARFRMPLEQSGHTIYAYPQDFVASGRKVDIVTSFDTIEHIDNPKDYVKFAFTALRKKGIFYLSMPQHDDLLNILLPEVYRKFHYQVAHLSYFNKRSVWSLFKGAGFRSLSIEYLHKYGINNLVQWAKFSSPGELKLDRDIFDCAFNDVYRAEIERLGVASHLFITAVK